MRRGGQRRGAPGRAPRIGKSDQTIHRGLGAGFQFNPIFTTRGCGAILGSTSVNSKPQAPSIRMAAGLVHAAAFTQTPNHPPRPCRPHTCQGRRNCHTADTMCFKRNPSHVQFFQFKRQPGCDFRKSRALMHIKPWMLNARDCGKSQQNLAWLHIPAHPHERRGRKASGLPSAQAHLPGQIKIAGLPDRVTD